MISADVLEHITPPVERSLETVYRLLNATGFFVITIFCNPEDKMREHYPELHDFRIVRLADSEVIINRRRDGKLELYENPVFHGGPGSTLEMREFGISHLKASLLSAGFSWVRFLCDDVPEFGILFDHDVSQPALAVKTPFAMSRASTAELVDAFSAAREIADQELIRKQALAVQIEAARRSRWVRLGRAFGLGPKLNSSL